MPFIGTLALYNVNQKAAEKAAIMVDMSGHMITKTMMIIPILKLELHEGNLENGSGKEWRDSGLITQDKTITFQQSQSRFQLSRQLSIQSRFRVV